MKMVSILHHFNIYRCSMVWAVALTLGAGVQWHEAYDAAHSRNVVVVGGVSAGGSVGAAGGWVQGGGHSALAPAYGLGAQTSHLNQTIFTDSYSCQVSTTCFSLPW